MAKNKRVNVKAILADPDLRRKLMVSTIQATQAREGIVTTEEQADRAYYVVSEGERSTFFALVPWRGDSSKPDLRQVAFVCALQGQQGNVRYDVARRDFASIDGQPLAYSRVSHLAPLFRGFPSLGDSAKAVEQGVASINIGRYVRYWWEIRESQIATSHGQRGRDKPWARFAKGGDYSRFYSDVYLVMLVDADWETMRDEANAKYPYLNGNTSLIIHPENHYFEEGLTWPRRTQRGFNMRLLPSGCVFGDKGPSVFLKDAETTWYVLGICNSLLAEYVLQALTSFGSWEQIAIKRLPLPRPSKTLTGKIGAFARSIHDLKRDWDEGNQVSTTFQAPWVLRVAGSLTSRLEAADAVEGAEQTKLDQAYSDLNTAIFDLFGVRLVRNKIEEELGERPRELVWPQMERKTVEQKRMEHVWRLLSYAVKRVVEADEDGIVPFASVSGETSLLDRVHQELAQLFPEQDINQVEVEITNELNRKVKGYKRASSIEEWLDNVYFDYHCSLYKSRPIIWHIASTQGSSPFAFGALCHYHKLDKNRMAKLRASYLRDANEAFRREAALADQEGRVEDRVEWQAKLEEGQALDQQLQAVQEGQHEGADGGDRDYRILTPWKSPEDRPKGWAPDIDDGVKVNVEPFQKAGVLRIGKVV